MYFLLIQSMSYTALFVIFTLYESSFLGGILNANMLQACSRQPPEAGDEQPNYQKEGVPSEIEHACRGGHFVLLKKSTVPAIYRTAF